MTNLILRLSYFGLIINTPTMLHLAVSLYSVTLENTPSGARGTRQVRPLLGQISHVIEKFSIKQKLNDEE